MRDWTALELGLLRDIFFRLPADADAVSFRHVCRRWNAIARGGALVPRPWFISHPSPYGPAGASTFLRPAGHRRSRVRHVRTDAAAIKGERAASARPRGTSRGWIAADDGKRLLLRDPVSGAEVPLPAFDPALQMFAVFLSDDPLAAAGRWEALAFFRKTDCSFLDHVLAFCRPGDAGWARLDSDDGQVADEQTFLRGLEFFRGRAYVLLFNSKIAVCDVDARRLVVTSVTMDRHRGWEEQERLVECGGELLLVQVAGGGGGGYETTRSSWWRCLRRSNRERFDVRVVKIELDPDGGGAPVGWSDVEGIGDHALFMATMGHVFALPASGFPAVRAGCVYHFNSYGNAQYAPQMIITDLRERPRRHEIVKKLPLDGHWHPLSWVCPVVLSWTRRRCAGDA